MAQTSAHTYTHACTHTFTHTCTYTHPHPHINTHTNHTPPTIDSAHPHPRPPPPLQAWLRSIEQCKAGLAAPLLVQHPDTGKLLVNFDKEIMQLVRETKYMTRFNVPVPESAVMVLLQVRARWCVCVVRSRR